MKINRFLYWIAVLFLSVEAGHAQNWQLVWQDEFDGSIGPDWVFEIGRGSGGWGNNELQYYRRENATIENNALVITARREAFGGANYTSARMKTQGRKSWKYGKMEARIAMPSVQGTWPAFWTLGDSISSVGWPACGEIDIMEHVNTEPNVIGALHWSGTNGGQADHAETTGANVTSYNIYAVEWTPTLIRWLVNGVEHMRIDITNGVGGTQEFHANQFILLNMAIGGNLPGNTVNDGALPVKMLVDYVRVYQDAGSGSGAFAVANRKSGHSLRTVAGGTANNTRLSQNPYDSTNHMKWNLVSVGGNQYRLSGVASGRAVSVNGASLDDNAYCKIYDYFGGNQQKFTLQDRGGGYNSVVFVHSGKAMTVLGGSTSAGADIIQFTNNGGTNAQWRFWPK
jgi:beta-glucanase (GH16 family)